MKFTEIVYRQLLEMVAEWYSYQFVKVLGINRWKITAEHTTYIAEV